MNPDDPNQGGGVPGGTSQPSAPEPAAENCTTCGGPSAGGNCTGCNQSNATCSCPPASTGGAQGTGEVGGFGTGSPVGGPGPSEPPPGGPSVPPAA